ncbi:hypothetical protein DSO57_1013239 [Entomophthora muscae]|uniref:Uncharacterized protein n=1 Tax=Entomophthora muscae TaxID=34485 RepID=A0ACC2SIL4_9FUNG|nr:hypothetical protein DSO57_1013239 [Entomophthora muscae]
MQSGGRTGLLPRFCTSQIGFSSHQGDAKDTRLFKGQQPQTTGFNSERKVFTKAYMLARTTEKQMGSEIKLKIDSSLNFESKNQKRK